MSQWTHVAGVIRYDAIRVLPISPAAQHLPTIFLAGIEPPTGSEGPLQWAVTENPEPAALAAYVTSFWGDLRDFGSPEDVQTVVDYFQATVRGHAVRQGCFTVDVEYGPTKTYRYRDGVGFIIVEYQLLHESEDEPL